MVKQLVKRSFAAFGFDLHRTPPADACPIRQWEQDADFRTVELPAHGRTLVDPIRLYVLYQLALHVNPLRGETAEVGVYRGGTARLLGPIFRRAGKRMHLFDTFQGMPETDPQ